MKGSSWISSTRCKKRPTTSARPPDLLRCQRRRFDLQEIGAGRSPLAALQYRLDQSIDVADIGTMIDDRRADRELSVQHRRGRRGNAGFLDVDDDLAIHRVGIIGAIAKTDDVE